MKCLSTGLVLAALAATSDPNRLPTDEARGYARLCAEQAANLADAQFKTDVDADRPCAVRGEGGGAMVIPDRGLSAEKLSKAGDGVVPVGQLWLRKWAPAVGGKAVPNDRLRIVTVKIEDKDRPMPLLLLGVRKKGASPELVVYARDSEPLLVLPLAKREAGQELPLELHWQRGDKAADTLTLGILGRYQAVLPVARQEK